MAETTLSTSEKLQFARAMALGLIALHVPGWGFKFNKRHTSFGMCNFETATISLSIHLTPHRTPEEIKRTILHEIAHAIAGPSAGHGPKWLQAARQIGMENPERCGGEAPEAALKAAPFVLECPVCKAAVPRYRKPNLARGYYVCNRHKVRMILKDQR